MEGAQLVRIQLVGIQIDPANCDFGQLVVFNRKEDVSKKN